ncbi:MAG: hypothetical protein QOI73_3551 [Solirubrobacteraceae bacterium]|nr:hypothetical protein [Solirubrobacteraceae bacterium]
MRYADPFVAAGRPETADHDFLLTCACGLEQRLDEMTLDEDGAITLYDCARCTQSVVGVMTAAAAADVPEPQGMARWNERSGHELRGYVIGSRVDVTLRPQGSDADVLVLPATPYFFVRYLNV